MKKIKFYYIVTGLLLAGVLLTQCKEERATTIAVTGVSLAPKSLSLLVGEATKTLTATVAPANATNKSITWTSSDEAVATVVNGVVTPKAGGTTTITATTNDGTFSATAQITVIMPVVVTGVLLFPKSLPLIIDRGTGKLRAIISPDNATNQSVSWTSSDEAVVTVVDGVITPKTTGTATITVTTADGSYTATATITVTAPAEQFISIWTTTAEDKDITLPLVSTGTYKFTVDWGDGSTDDLTAWDDPKKTHTYTTAGNDTVTIIGTLSGWSFMGEKEPVTHNNYADANAIQLKEIKSWGSLAFGDTFGQFAGVTYLVISATDAPDLTQTTSLKYCFLYDSLFNSPINHWNTGTITNMSFMLTNAEKFNQDIGSWNTEKVTMMVTMFGNARKFNQDISNWNTANVINMADMFYFAKAFSQDLSGWNVDKVNTRRVNYKSSFAWNSGLSGDQWPKFSEN